MAKSIMTIKESKPKIMKKSKARTSISKGKGLPKSDLHKLFLNWANDKQDKKLLTKYFNPYVIKNVIIPALPDNLSLYID